MEGEVHEISAAIGKLEGTLDTFLENYERARMDNIRRQAERDNHAAERHKETCTMLHGFVDTCTKRMDEQDKRIGKIDDPDNGKLAKIDRYIDRQRTTVKNVTKAGGIIAAVTAFWVSLRG